MEKYIGVVKHYFNRLGVAVVSLSDEVKINDIVHVQGHTTDFCQKIRSLEMSHHQVDAGKPNKDIAVKVIGTVRRGDKIYLAPEAEPTETKEYPEQRIDEWDR